MKESKYPIKVAAVRMLDEGRSVGSICKELHIGPKSLRLWYQQYKQGGEHNLLPKRHSFQLSYEEKLKIVQDIVDNSIPLTSASIKYIISHETLRSWLISFKSLGPEGLHRKNESRMSKKRNYTDEELDELEQLRRRNEWLEAENALLKKVRALVEEKEARLRATGQKPSKN